MYVPDYTVRVVEDCLIIKVTRAIYIQALRTTKLKTWEHSVSDGEEFELHLICNDYAEDEVSAPNSSEPSPISHRSNKVKRYAKF